MDQLPFDPADPKAALAQLPPSAAVFALYGADAHAEPYIGRTPNLRARLERLLLPSEKHPRRLQLAGRVRRIEFRLTGSDFESLFLQFELLAKIYSAKALERMHLGAPSFIRYLGSNAYPRITVTNRPSQREADWAYGPFQSRAAAERFAEEALKLFLLRRCTFELDPDPSYPGCVYSEMKMCLAPCYKGCTDERYAEESTAVESFLSTRGESRLVTLRTEREKASADLEFESAAALHAQVQRVEAVRSLAPELVRPLSQLRAIILQASADPDEVAVFLFENARLRGPAAFSTLGMRIQNEQSGSSSLFAQPMAIEPIPEPAEIRDQGSGVGDQTGITEGSLITDGFLQGTGLSGLQGTGLSGLEGAGLSGLQGAGLSGLKGAGLSGLKGTGLSGLKGTGLSGLKGTGLSGLKGAGLSGLKGTGLSGLKGAGLSGLKGAGLSGLKGTGLSGLKGAGLSGLKGAGLSGLKGAGLSGLKGTGLGGLKGTGLSGLKGTGFSPYISQPELTGALAPEGSLSADSPAVGPQPAKLPRGLLESRLEAALAALAEPSQPPSSTLRQGHLALLKRWYYRPEVRRTGEIFFPDPEGQWPVKQILRAIGRIAAKSLLPAGRA